MDGGMGFVIVTTTSWPEPHGPIHDGLRMPAPALVLHMFCCHCLHRNCKGAMRLRNATYVPAKSGQSHMDPPTLACACLAQRWSCVWPAATGCIREGFIELYCRPLTNAGQHLPMATQLPQPVSSMY